MFKINDLLWLPIGNDWGEDWGIVMAKIAASRRRRKSTVGGAIIEFYYHI